MKCTLTVIANVKPAETTVSHRDRHGFYYTAELQFVTGATLRSSTLTIQMLPVVGASPLHRQRSASGRSCTHYPSLRTYASMETGQGTSTVSVSPPEILSGKEIQPSTPKAILRTDYRPTPYLVNNVHLTFLLGDTTRVKSKLSFVPNYEGSPPALALDGMLSPVSHSCKPAIIPYLYPSNTSSLDLLLTVCSLSCKQHFPQAHEQVCQTAPVASLVTCPY